MIKLSQAVSALGDHSTDIFSTVRNLQLLVSALSSSSDLLAAFNTNLADVTTVLSNTPNEIADATTGLDGAVNDLRGFVAENREGLGVTVDHLDAITTALNDSRGDVKQVLHITPTVFQNFMNIYQPAQSAVTGILAPVNFANTVQFICSAIQAASRRVSSSRQSCAFSTLRRSSRTVSTTSRRWASTRSSERRRGRTRSPTARTGSTRTCRRPRVPRTPPPDRCLPKRRCPLVRRPRRSPDRSQPGAAKV